MDVMALMKSSARKALARMGECFDGKERETFQSVVECLPAAVFAVQGRRIVLANGAFLEMTGYASLEEVKGLSLDDVFLPGTMMPVGEHAPEDGKGHYEVSVVKSSGEVRTWEVRSVRMILNSREAMLSVADDLTERKLLEQQDEETRTRLMQESRLASVGFFAAGIAHNLGNPLTSIYTIAQLIRQGHPDIEEAQRIISQCRTMMNIIRNLMTKSRMDQMDEEMDIDLNELLENELMFYEANLEFKNGITKDYHFGEGLPLVRGVYSDLSQAVMNIVKNAEDAMCESERRRLAVRTFSEGRNVCVEIRDTGCGIPEEHMDRIFDPFFTTKPMRTDRPEGRPTGTGLGMASSLQLLKKYRGTIQVRSVVGEGTTVTLVIPGKA